MELLAALTLGLLGSFHCVGMCGPIALALPLNRNSLLTKIIGATLYNIGRTITYAVMGALFGLFGKGLVLAGFQNIISIILGSIMILSVFTPLLFKKTRSLESYIAVFTGKLKGRLRQLFAINSYSSLFFIGLLNGLLPCGLVYMAIAGALATGSVYSGTVFMVLFGIGTIPMMFGISVISSSVSISVRNKIKKVMPVFIVLLGLVFILRGLNLGIKYISPPTEKLQVKTEMKMNNSHTVQ
ncbi:MAG: sulfite exporter TauE/SafE family protein [Chlorobi bacterium]|nr:sulfite exporter TauE/SafE family protein [Chlorobiota bacterium]